MKLKNALIGIIAAIVLLTIGICFVIGTGVLNPLEHQLFWGYKYLEQGKYEEAILAFNKAIEIDDKKVDAYLGKAQAEIKLGDSEDALATIETAIKIVADIEQTYSLENFKTVVEWWIENADSSNSSFEEIIKLISEYNSDTIGSYEWGESKYETEEPYKEYQELYVNGKKTGHKKYTGYFATGKWINEGYESEEPYKEYERLYLNSEPTDKIRYTGKTRPRVVSLNEDEAKDKLQEWLGDLGTWVAGEENVLVCDGLYTCEGKEYYQFRLRGWVYDHATTLTWYVISKDGTEIFEGDCNTGKLNRY